MLSVELYTGNNAKIYTFESAQIGDLVDISKIRKLRQHSEYRVYVNELIFLQMLTAKVLRNTAMQYKLYSTSVSFDVNK